MKRLSSILGAAALALALALVSAAGAQSIGPNWLKAGAAAAVSSAITSASASSSFTPSAGRAFHIQLSGTAGATCYLERELDGSTWAPITVTSGGTTTILYNWAYANATVSEDVLESQYGVPYRVDCGSTLGSFASGTLNVRFSQ